MPLQVVLFWRQIWQRSVCSQSASVQLDLLVVFNPADAGLSLPPHQSVTADRRRPEPRGRPVKAVLSGASQTGACGHRGGAPQLKLLLIHFYSGPWKSLQLWPKNNYFKIEFHLKPWSKFANIWTCEDENAPSLLSGNHSRESRHVRRIMNDLLPGWSRNTASPPWRTLWLWKSKISLSQPG